MKGIIAGTFTIFHDGHKALFNAAVDLKIPIIVGLTSDAFIQKTKPYKILPFEERKKQIEEYLLSRGAEFVIKSLDSTEGNSTTEKEYSHIIVSEETAGNAERINEKRQKNGLDLLIVVEVPIKLANDLFPISSRRIIRGEIDLHGNVLHAIKVTVGGEWQEFFGEGYRYLKNAFGNMEVYFSPASDKEIPAAFNSDYYGICTERAMGIMDASDFSIGLCIAIRKVNNRGIMLASICCVIIDRIGRIHVGESSTIEIDARCREYIDEGFIKKGEEILKLLDQGWIGRSVSDSINSVLISIRKNTRKDLENQIMYLE
ncbi:MAG: phosphopantetheine adenylyltransferase [Thermoplasmataceae archaeon]